MPNPIEFPEVTTTVAKNQPQYRPIPAFIDTYSPEGRMIFCWQFTDEEIAEIVRTRCIWHQVQTFGGNLQPQMLMATKPDMTPSKPMASGHAVGRPVNVISYDYASMTVRVVFTDDGSTARIPCDALILEPGQFLPGPDGELALTFASKRAELVQKAFEAAAPGVAAPDLQKRVTVKSQGNEPDRYFLDGELVLEVHPPVWEEGRMMLYCTGPFAEAAVAE